MKEVVFIRQNTEKWKHYDNCLRNIAAQTPDVLADIYVDVTNDLSFARTYYPNSKTTSYLNKLSSRLHHFIYGKKKERYSRIITFWTQELPLVMYDARKELLISFIIFSIGMLIGAFSAIHDENFTRLVLGDQYVDMTLANIKNGDPMAVYKHSSESLMFSYIPLNNIKVSFNIFVAGIFTAVSSAFILIYNAIILGAFQELFYEHGLLRDSILAVWIHGTLEISAIIIAGAGGIALGNGWLFPGTYTRFESFRRGAVKGMKIIVGLIPVFILAGFLESYITRHTNIPDFLRLSIILGSLAFVIFYFIIYPGMLVRNAK